MLSWFFTQPLWHAGREKLVRIQDAILLGKSVLIDYTDFYQTILSAEIISAAVLWNHFPPCNHSVQSICFKTHSHLSKCPTVWETKNLTYWCNKNNIGLPTLQFRPWFCLYAIRLKGTSGFVSISNIIKSDVQAEILIPIFSSKKLASVLIRRQHTYSSL